MDTIKEFDVLKKLEETNKTYFDKFCTILSPIQLEKFAKSFLFGITDKIEYLETIVGDWEGFTFLIKLEGFSYNTKILLKNNIVISLHNDTEIIIQAYKLEDLYVTNPDVYGKTSYFEMEKRMESPLIKLISSNLKNYKIIANYDI